MRILFILSATDLIKPTYMQEILWGNFKQLFRNNNCFAIHPDVLLVILNTDRQIAKYVLGISLVKNVSPVQLTRSWLHRQQKKKKEINTITNKDSQRVHWKLSKLI